MRDRGIGSLIAACGLLTACGQTSEQADPRIAALWASPAACGSEAYQWLDDARLGEVGEWVENDLFDYTADALEGLLSGAGVTIARELVHDVRVFQFRYQTQDRGQLTEATALIAVPAPLPGGSPRFPLLAYLHGTGGFSDGCSPSNELVTPVAISGIASFGFVVVAPDYLGLKGMGEPSTQIHPYLVAEPTAIASLDSVRAARRLLAGALPVAAVAEPDLLVLGGSQGGHASLAVAWYGPYYAPEEEIIAMAASVPPADLVTETQGGALTEISATRNLAAYLGAFADWYGADLSEVIRPPVDATVIAHLQSSCGLSGVTGNARAVEEIFTDAFRQQAAWGFPADGGPWSCRIRANSFLHTPVEPLRLPPTLFVLSELDGLVNTPIERGSFDHLCDRGFPLQYLECAGVDHTEGALGSLAEQVEFLLARWNREPWSEDQICRRTQPVQCSGSVDLP
jgi:dienelactone hydrolase